jgi:hypothetical protein
VRPLSPRSPLRRSGGSRFGDHAPTLAAGGGATVYLAPAPADVVKPSWRGSIYVAPTSGVRARAVPVGEVAVVRGLLSWGRQRMNLSAVEALQLPQTVIGPTQAATMARQLQRASEACDGTHAGAIGLSAHGASGLVRGFPCPDGPILLLAIDGAALWASTGGLLLDLPDRQLQVLGWRVTADHVCASTPVGETDLTGTSGEHLLTRLAPGLDEIDVRGVSLRSTFTGLFVGAVERAREAATTGVPMLSWHDAER